MTTHNAPRGRLHLPHLHVWEGWRKYVTTFLGLLVTAGLGLAAAQWITIPSGNGHAFGHAKNGTVGLALTEVTLTDSDLLGLPVGPGDTGQLTWRVHNPNGVGVTVNQIAPAGPISRIDDPTCVAAASTFDATPWTGALAVGAGLDSVKGDLAITLHSDFPGCMAGGSFTLPVTISATAS
jgi:hypothetical protein